MPQIRKAFFGAAATTLALSAAQLAFGHDLAGRWSAVPETSSNLVNRAAKADRITDPKAATVPMRTVSLRLNDLADTSVMIRVPLAAEARSVKPPILLQNHIRKPTVACEPVVSSLTDVAKQFFRYGQGRARTVRAHPESLSPRQLAAPALVVALVLPTRRRVVPLYLVGLAVAALWQTRREPKLAPATGLAMSAMHVPWGVGFWLGLLRRGR